MTVNPSAGSGVTKVLDLPPTYLWPRVPLAIGGDTISSALIVPRRCVGETGIRNKIGADAIGETSIDAICPVVNIINGMESGSRVKCMAYTQGWRLEETSIPVEESHTIPSGS